MHSPKLSEPEEWPQSLKEAAQSGTACIFLFAPSCPSSINLAVSIPPALSSVIRILDLKPFLSHFSCLLLLNPSFFYYLFPTLLSPLAHWKHPLTPAKTLRCLGLQSAVPKKLHFQQTRTMTERGVFQGA